VADVQRDEQTPQVLGLRLLELGEQLHRLGGRLGGVDALLLLRGRGVAPERARVFTIPSSSSFGVPSRVAHDDLDRHELLEREGRTGRLGLERRHRGVARLRERGGGDLAERLDVESAARADVLDAAAHLRGAGSRVRAAQVDVALLAGARIDPHSGQRSGITNSRSVPSRRSTTGPSTSGSRRRPCAARPCRR
jgi:hypothetical protein